jgi:hypothetical protein
LGYQFLARLSLAAVVSLGSRAGAAGAIDGAVTFPAELVPSMTVFASDVDTSAIHSVQLVRGQANFTVNVPPGRYLVFMAPNEAGARTSMERTRSTACARRTISANVRITR